ncbi:Pns1-like protein, partial [Globisporangium splendens]
MVYTRSDTAQEQREYVAHEPIQSKRECNDVFFLLPFLFLVGLTIYFAGSYGSDFIDATQVQGLSENTGIRVLLKYVLTSGFAAMGMSLVWIGIMIVAGKILIWLALGVIILLNIVAAYVFTKLSYDSGTKFYWWPAVVFGLFAFLMILYACCVRKRIKFAAAHLRVAGSAVFRLPMTLVVAAVMVLVQVGWAFTWSLGSLGLMFHQDYLKIEDVCTVDNCDVKVVTGAVLGVLCGMMLVYFWCTFVLKNIIGVTVAGTVAAWKNASTSPFITLGAWLRAVTLNLGSICFGSLIVAILETIRWMLSILASMANQSGNCAVACIFSCLSCIIGCIESWIEFFNRFAYTYVGCYGYSFVTASRHVFKLFKSKGWSAIVNDDLTGNVFFLGNLIIGAVSAYIAVKMVHDTDKERLAMFEHPDVIVAIFAFLIGYGVNNLFMTVIASAVTTIFVLWAEDPHGWQLTRPDHYARLHSAWLEIYPEEYNDGYGKQVDNSV